MVTDAAKEAIVALGEIEKKIDERLGDYLSATIGLCKLVKEGRGEMEVEDFLKKLKGTWESLQSKRKKIMDDPALREEIMG